MSNKLNYEIAPIDYAGIRDRLINYINKKMDAKIELKRDKETKKNSIVMKIKNQEEILRFINIVEIIIESFEKNERPVILLEKLIAATTYTGVENSDIINALIICNFEDFESIKVYFINRKREEDMSFI